MEVLSTILIAEDNVDDVFLAKRALLAAGYDNPVQIASDGQEAIDYLLGNGKFNDRIEFPVPQLLILDLKMPRLNGLEVLNWLRHHPTFQVVPTIILSSSRLDSDVCEAFRCGAQGYFIKPLTAQELTEIFKVIRTYWSHSIKPHAETCKKILEHEAKAKVK
jgi:CheY-like chemotaxis protein